MRLLADELPAFLAANHPANPIDTALASEQADEKPQQGKNDKHPVTEFDDP
jgi:hypothetical protein